MIQAIAQNLVIGILLGALYGLAAVGFDAYQKSRKAKETVEKVAL
jgi:hypothetical protein